MPNFRCISEWTNINGMLTFSLMLASRKYILACVSREPIFAKNRSNIAVRRGNARREFLIIVIEAHLLLAMSSINRNLAEGKTAPRGFRMGPMALEGAHIRNIIRQDVSPKPRGLATLLVPRNCIGNPRMPPAAFT